MANTAVSSIITDVDYDLLIDSDDTGRDNEIIAYINRFNRHILFPMLKQYNSDFGWTEWNTSETVANVRKVTLPSGFVAFESLYLMQTVHSGTATSGSSTSIVLDSDASDSDDAYNSYILRTTGGTGDGQQFVITDYDGDTLTATTSETITTGFSTDTTFIIFKWPREGNRLEQKNQDYVLGNFNTSGVPSVYSMTALSSETSYMYLGDIPADVYALLGWYYSHPSKLTATTDYLPYHPIFDEFIRQYVTFLAMNRDEYNVEIEMKIMATLEDKIIDVILSRQDTDGGSVPYKGAGDT